MDSERVLFSNELPNSLQSTFNSPKFIFYFEQRSKIAQKEQSETFNHDNRDINSLFDPKRLIKRILDCTGLIQSFAFVDVPKHDISEKGEDSAKIMREIPAGILPAMLVDGVFLVGLPTISRSLAARTGLDGCSLLENGQIDMITDILLKTIENMESLLRSDVVDNEVANDIVSITPLMSFVEAEIYCNVLPYLDLQLGRNGRKYMIGNRETWADHTLDYFLEILHSIIVTMPQLFLVGEQNHGVFFGTKSTVMPLIKPFMLFYAIRTIFALDFMFVKIILFGKHDYCVGFGTAWMKTPLT